MIYYRLLRDNKETGPYSEEDMIAKGFKPYDLLWAEGRSAGWQYPSEIAAFKKYAPIVEEQPYDRFFKKPSTQQTPAAVERVTSVAYASGEHIAKAGSQAEPAQQAFSRPAPSYNLEELPARHIHVTLPSGNTLNLSTLVVKKESKETPDTVKAAALIPATENKIVEQRATAIEPTTSITVPASKDDQHYLSQPQSDFLGNANFSWTLLLGAVVGIATLVGLGIMIGLSMNREKNNLAFNEALLNKTSRQLTSTNAAAPVTPVFTTAQPIAPSIDSLVRRTPVQIKNREITHQAVVKTVAATANPVKEEKSSSVPEAGAEKNKDLQQAEPPVLHTKALPVISTANIEKALRVTANDFKTGAFGGISNLKYTLVNGSKQPVESVEIEISYIQANNKVYKTETLLFKDIAAGGQATIPAPPSSRGVKVSSRITRVNARETSLSTITAKS